MNFEMTVKRFIIIITYIDYRTSKLKKAITEKLLILNTIYFYCPTTEKNIFCEVETLIFFY